MQVADDAYSVVAAVKRDLDLLPVELRASATAIAALRLAESIDLGTETYRFQASLVAQLRECLAELVAKAPPKPAGDAVDDLNARRAARQKAASAGRTII